MNLTDLLEKIYSKKTSIAVTSLVVVAWIKAPPVQATIIACVAIITQGLVDLYKIKKGVKNEPKTG